MKVLGVINMSKKELDFLYEKHLQSDTEKEFKKLEKKLKSFTKNQEVK